MRILLIEEFDSAPVPQALQCENIAFDMVPPPEEDEPSCPPHPTNAPHSARARRRESIRFIEKTSHRYLQG